MNWLAHTFLSAPETQFQLGNLLADLVRGADRARMTPGFRRGADCHKIIDAFTDSHLVVKQSRQRLPEQYRRFSGVVIDVFYDHLLAKHWTRYASIPLTGFTQAFYASVRPHMDDLPESARATLGRIVRHDLLGSYREIGGVEHALRRISAYLTQRWGRAFAIESCVPALLAAESSLDADFAEFFPQLQVRVAQWLATPQ